MARSETLHHHWEFEPPVLDANYPEWARRSNPIVRRHLGVRIKTFPPQFGTLAMIFLVQAVLIMLTIPIPFLFGIAVPLITVSVFLLPVAFYYYTQTLLGIARDSATIMIQEKDNNTLHLLRTTPFTTREILLGKVAASMWRRADDLTLLLAASALFGLPTILMIFAGTYPPEQYPTTSQVGIVIAFGSSILRIMLEPFMIGAMGVMAGAVVPLRSGAVTATMLFGFFYFLLINLARLLPLSLPMMIVVEGILPLVLPLVISVVALRLAAHFMNRD